MTKEARKWLSTIADMRQVVPTPSRVWASSIRKYISSLERRLQRLQNETATLKEDAFNTEKE